MPIKEIKKKTSLDEVSIMHALRFLEQKKILNLKIAKKEIISLGTNGIYYKKNNLPERNLLHVIEKNNHSSLINAKTLSKLSENEFNAALGVLKNKALIKIENGKISLIANKNEVVKKFPEEKLIDILPIEKNKLNDEEMLAFGKLKNRKNIIELVYKKEITAEFTELGKKLSEEKTSYELIEEITPELIKSGARNLHFRRYNPNVNVPRISGGKRHFLNQTIEKARKIWLELGFKEMEGPIADSAFWNFDALFTAQDHPVREMQDTFYLRKITANLPSKELIEKIKEAHESPSYSRGWNYKWDEDEARKVVLRTHTTSLSARALSKIKEEDIPVKLFAVGKSFRNETIDWSHSIEFYQTEGIVVSNDVSFINLLGYLKEFYKKMGFEKIRFRPSFFPYTEPSLEIEVFHPGKNIWLELGGAGIFRPEVTIPLLGKAIPVLAWGQGLDRIALDLLKINDLREVSANDIRKLRESEIII